MAGAQNGMYYPSTENDGKCDKRILYKLINTQGVSFRKKGHRKLIASDEKHSGFMLKFSFYVFVNHLMAYLIIIT